MGKKLFTGFVITFWAVMMAALVRVEYFPQQTQLLPVSSQHVLEKFFKNPATTHLDVIYQNQGIGRLNLEIIPLATVDTEPTDQAPATVGAYEVTGDLWVNLVVLGAPTKLRVKPIKMLFDSRYELKAFRIRTGFGQSDADIQGNNDTKQLKVSYDLGEGRQSREVNYSDLKNGNALTALGLPGLQAMPGLGALGLMGGGSPGATAQSLVSRLKTRTYRDYLTIGDIDQRTYLVEWQLDQGLGIWVKLWLDEQGSLLKADSSLGFSLLSQTLVATEGKNIVDRVFERAPRKP